MSNATYQNGGPAAIAHAARAIKLLRVALDPAAADGEAVNAATMFARTARRDGVTFPVLALAAARQLPGDHAHPCGGPAPSAAAAGSVRMRVGKYAGRRLADIVVADPGYVAWVAENYTDARIARAAADVLDAADRGEL